MQEFHRSLAGRLVPGVLLLIALLVVQSAVVGADPTTGTMAPDARPIVDALYGSMGGRDAFLNLKSLRFTCSFTTLDTLRSTRTHWWSRMDGRYRVEGRTRAGQSYIILFNTMTKDGSAWLDGKLLGGEEATKWVDRGYSLFINDTYWLLLPLKLDDPGENVVKVGEAEVDGAPSDRLCVTFDQVGLTPGDTYWAYIDRKDHRMSRWGFILQDDAGPKAVEQQWDWRGWGPVGPLTLARERVALDDSARTVIRFDDLEAGAAWPDSLFTTTTPQRPDRAPH